MQDSRNQFTTKFFQHLDTPTMILFFEADEFMLGMGMYMFLMIFASLFDIVLPGGVLIYAGIAIVTMWGYMKFKKNKPNGYTMQKLYRKGMIEPRNISIKNIFSTKKKKKFKVLPYGFVKTFRGI